VVLAKSVNLVVVVVDIIVLTVIFSEVKSFFEFKKNITNKTHKIPKIGKKNFFILFF
jgi:hypothetical protein